MEIKIDLAGIILRVTGPDEDLFLESGVLAPFLTDANHIDREVTCRIVESFPPVPREPVFANASCWVYRDGEAIVSFMGSVGMSPDRAYIWARRDREKTELRIKRDALPDRITPKTLLNGLEAEALIVQNNGFLFHCSYIEHEGGAILFTAPSGTGKSTQADLWREYRGAKIINGDRAAVRLGRQGFEAWGVPFYGSSGISHRRCLPIRAIVYLSQAPRTTICRLRGMQAFRKLWEGCSLHTWDRDDVALCSETVMNAAQQVPVFHLACTPDESAVLALEQALNQTQR